MKKIFFSLCLVGFSFLHSSDDDFRTFEQVTEQNIKDAQQAFKDVSENIHEHASQIVHNVKVKIEQKGQEAQKHAQEAAQKAQEFLQEEAKIAQEKIQENFEKAQNKLKASAASTLSAAAKEAQKLADKLAAPQDQSTPAEKQTAMQGDVKKPENLVVTPAGDAKSLAVENNFTGEPSLVADFIYSYPYHLATAMAVSLILYFGYKYYRNLNKNRLNKEASLNTFNQDDSAH